MYYIAFTDVRQYYMSVWVDYMDETRCDVTVHV